MLAALYISEQFGRLSPIIWKVSAFEGTLLTVSKMK